MKLVLFTTIVAPVVDFLVTDGRYIAVLIAHVASVAHGIANAGATLMPSFGG